MIVVNGHIIEMKAFPDGTPMLLDMPEVDTEEKHAGAVLVKWLYDAREEFALYATCMHYANKGAHLELVIPYFPNARMDRTEHDTEVNTLRAFIQMLASIPNVDIVQVWDPHSEATVKQLEELVTQDVDIVVGYRALFASIWYTLRENNIDCVVFPDAGAKKKYSELFPRYQRVTSALRYLDEYPKLYGEKIRDWDTGKIQGLRILNASGDEMTRELVELCDIKSVLIVDDICAYGGTIYHCANKLREVGVEKIYAHISHTEDSIYEGHLLKSDESPIDGYVTTDDILHVDKMPLECDVPLKVSIAMRDGMYKAKNLRFD